MSMKFILLIYVNCQQMFALHNIYKRDKCNTCVLKSWGKTLIFQPFSFWYQLNIMLIWAEHEKFITSGPGLTYQRYQCNLERLEDL